MLCVGVFLGLLRVLAAGQFFGVRGAVCGALGFCKFFVKFCKVPQQAALVKHYILFHVKHFALFVAGNVFAEVIIAQIKRHVKQNCFSGELFASRLRRLREPLVRTAL